MKTEGLETGKGGFYTSFASAEYKNDVTPGKDLYVRMNLGKTMYELTAENGMEASFTAYGFVNIFIDGEKILAAGPYSFASNISKVWDYIDIPLNISPDFVDKISGDQSLLETNQDIWVFQQMFQDSSIHKKYAAFAFALLSSGSHKLRVEFGLGESGAQEPGAIVCSAEVNVSAEGADIEAMIKNLPKHMRPLEESEKGKFIVSNNPFIAGINELSASMELPQPPKYYNMKWCQATSCDYDSGYLEFYVSIDNIPVTAWSAKLHDADYTERKNFDFVILPKTDDGLGTYEAAFNNSDLFKSENSIVYALLDMLYGGHLSTGKHELRIKVYSQQCVPLNTDYEFQNDYFEKWPAIAESKIEFIVSEEGLNALTESSCTKKLSHADGDWVEADNILKRTNTNGPEFEIIDVATQTEWKVITNAFGIILYRECKADVIYKSGYGCRIQKRLGVRSDYLGDGTYGSPYFTERIEFSYGPSLLNSMHLPIPFAKTR